MTNLLALIDASTTPTTVAKKTSGSSSYELIVIVIIFAVVYFAFIRPRSRRQRAARTQGTPMDVGDRVMSVGGIYGTVVAMHDAEGGADPTVEVEVAPGMVLTFLRRAVNARPQVAVANDVTVDEDGYDEPDDEGNYADPEPYGDFDEHGEFHEHGQTPAHDDAPLSEADVDEAQRDTSEHDGSEHGGSEHDGSEQDEDDLPAPGAPRSTGGTGPEGD
jgi:preprotein translocase subunit YajC